MCGNIKFLYNANDYPHQESPFEINLPKIDPTMSHILISKTFWKLQKPKNNHKNNPQKLPKTQKSYNEFSNE